MLQLKNIVKSFAVNFEPVLKDINLRLKTGDFCVVIGANGSGKSTLLKTISGEYSADAGKIVIDEREYAAADRRKFIAQVVQDVNKGTIPELTLLENLALTQIRLRSPRLRLYHRFQNEAILTIKELGIGLEKFIHQPLGNLSGGQRQIVATLMAIHSNPQILLLDEHTSALDPQMQKLLMEYTAKAISTHNMTSLMITHKMDEAIQYGNRLLMLHQGKIVLDLSGASKQAVKAKELLALFHQYEDLSLLKEVVNEH